MIPSQPAIIGPDRARGARQAVYFLKPVGRAIVKIGHGCPVATRMREIQCGSPEHLEAILLLEGGRKLEGAIHAALSGHALRGEWYHLNSLTCSLIQTLAGCEGDFYGEVIGFAERRWLGIRSDMEARVASLPAADLIVAEFLPFSSQGRAA